MSQSAKLRHLHLTILAAIKQAEEIEIPIDFSVGASLLLLHEKDQLVYGLENVIFNQLYAVKRVEDIIYPAIETEEIDKLCVAIDNTLSN
jgi:hypothetical protein